MSSSQPEATTDTAPERAPGYDPSRLEYALTIRGLTWGDLRRPPFMLSHDGMTALRAGRPPARNQRSMDVLKRVIALLEERYPVKPSLVALMERPS